MAAVAGTWRRRILKMTLASKRIRLPGQKTEAVGLPLRVRPTFIVLTVVTLIVLSILGFHPSLSSRMVVNDKLLHFVCFALATGFFWWVWEIDDAARRVWIWRNFQTVLSGFVCFGCGAIGSEFVQSALPYKQFDFFDIVANLFGAGLGLWIATLLEQRHRRQRELASLYAPLNPEDAYPSDDETELAEQMYGGQSSRAADAWRDSISELSVPPPDDESPRRKR